MDRFDAMQAFVRELSSTSLPVEALSSRVQDFFVDMEAAMVDHPLWRESGPEVNVCLLGGVRHQQSHNSAHLILQIPMSI